jgi:hypothetical protein
LVCDVGIKTIARDPRSWTVATIARARATERDPYHNRRRCAELCPLIGGRVRGEEPVSGWRLRALQGDWLSIVRFDL